MAQSDSEAPVINASAVAENRRGAQGRRKRLAVLLAIAGPILLVYGPALAQGTAPGVRPVAPPVAPSGSPQILRPTATLGPAPPTGGPGQSTAAVQAGPGGAGAVLRPAGVARFRSMAKPDVVMFDAPSDKAKKIFLAPLGMPVEVVSVLRNWVKVRDPLGDLAWVSRDDLTDRRMLIATTISPLRREAQANSASWFSVDRGVVLELLDEKPVNGFLKVRFAEGQVGYVQSDQVWGL
jgi:SH3-like domain-containing protein